MKKKSIIYLSLIAGLLYSSASFAQQYTPKILYSSDITDLDVANYVGDKDYLNKIISQDPSVIKRFNDNEKEKNYLGFRYGTASTLSLLISSDPSLFFRKDDTGRNILLRAMYLYYEDLSKTPQESDQVEMIKQITKYNPQWGKKLEDKLKNRDINSIKEYEESIIDLMKMLPPSQLNAVDSNGNNALVYAVYNRNIRIISYLLSNPNFKMSTSTNNYGESALFMLFGENCSIKGSEEKNILILKMLLDAGLNPMEKNKYGKSFASIVYTFDDFNYFKPVLNNSLRKIQVTLLQKQSPRLKAIVLNEKKSISEIEVKGRYGYYTANALNLNYGYADCGLFSSKSK